MSRAKPYRYEKLTWQDADRAARDGRVVILPIGALEQHGPHLPLDVDCLLARGVTEHAAELVPDRVLLMPTLMHGYTAHVMDFPGTINVDWKTLADYVVDVGRSLAYHGFKKIVVVNGHGSNMPVLNLACRRITLETDAECAPCAWWSLLTVDPAFLPKWRQSPFPGGCAHACELETSAYLYLDEANVRKDLIRSEEIAFNKARSDFEWCDLFAAGPAMPTPWTSSYTESGTCGDAELATAEKGLAYVTEAARQLARMVVEFAERPRPPRKDHHQAAPTMPMPWNQPLPPLPQLAKVAAARG